MTNAEVVVCGAGMAGAAAAYHLAVRHRLRNVVIVDEREPLTLTSDKGTQGYRNWFDGPDDTMARFVGRSVGIMEELAEESGNAFLLSRTGYAFVTAEPSMRERIRTQAERLATFGAGAVREHPGPVPYQANSGDDWRGIPDGADLLFDPALVHEHFAFVNDAAIAVSHVRRAGWMDAIRLGRWLLDEACRNGARPASTRRRRRRRRRRARAGRVSRPERAPCRRRSQPAPSAPRSSSSSAVPSNCWHSGVSAATAPGLRVPPRPARPSTTT